VCGPHSWNHGRILRRTRLPRLSDDAVLLAGYGKAIQVVVPGAAFGLSHAGYRSQGLMVWLGIMLPTALLGVMWGDAYLLVRRSLLPGTVAHFLNDATALRWIVFLMVTSTR